MPTEQNIQPSYFQQRMEILGVTEENNKVDLYRYNAETRQNELFQEPIFRETNAGIEILVYTIDRLKIPYAKEGSRYRLKDYCITRLAEPRVKKDGSTQKYDMPKGHPVLPFFPVQLLEQYEQKKHIPTLYLTEGYFKAWKAQSCGIDCVGLPSITCMRDRESGQLHADIKKLIEVCAVERIVWLTDGDCRDITSKEITDGIDLYRRPQQFFRTVQTFYDLLSPFENVNKYWAHINSENLEGTPKGLDDLLCAFPKEQKAILKEFNSFDKQQEHGNYLVKFNISFGVGNIHRYFMLHDVDVFYLFHVERRKELQGKDFKFNGTLYAYDETEAKCKIKVPSSAANYFRVGDKYYEHLQIPNRYGELSKTYHRREKDTIREDNGKDIFKHVQKFKAFCTVPDHVNYQRVINNCFNVYFPFEHEPEQGDYEQTLNFIKHIFGTDIVTTKDGKQIFRYELGLDYLTLLYKKPQQILPILCLVSSERQTGKTTFAKWLNMIFTENMAIVGNEDLAAQFNAHWSSKLLIACDETKIDKHVVMEKIKSLSTASNIMMNAKGRDQVSMEFFGKFILLSNNEDNFATIDREEIRFWVISVPTIKERNVNLLQDLLEEIPAFLNFLNSRKMITEEKERHWFDTELLKTEALKKVVENSRPSFEKMIKTSITELFEATELDTITIPLKAIASELLRKPHDKDYIKTILHKMDYKTENPGRKSYPRIIEERDGENVTEKAIPITFNGRYYQFERKDFINYEDGEQSPF